MLFFFPKFEEFAHNLVYFLVNMAIMLTQELFWLNKAVFCVKLILIFVFRY